MENHLVENTSPDPNMPFETTRTIASVAQLLEISTRLVREFGEQVWWRGQTSAKADWTLRPKVFRDDGQGGTVEQDLAARFIDKAPTRSPAIPRIDDLAGWLFLMQHHGLPTRLLDWSCSPLVAAFFATDGGDPAASAAIWAVAPTRLNVTQVGGEPVVYGVGSAQARPMIHAAFRADGGEALPNLAIRSAENNLRMMAQMSEFTLHGNRTPLDELPDAQTFLRKFEIGPAEILSIDFDLHYSGHTTSHLYPDLDHLAQDLTDNFFVPAGS